MGVKVQSDVVQGKVGARVLAGGSRIPVQLSGGRREALLVAVTVRREAAVAAAPVVAVRGEAVKRRRRKVKLLHRPISKCK